MMDKILVKIGRIIREKRKELKISSKELAKKLGYESFVSIHYIETGKKSLPINKVNIIDSILGEDIGKLIHNYHLGKNKIIKNKIHNIIKQKRILLKLRTTDLSKITGIPVSYISGIERGKMNVPFCYIRKLSTILKIPEKELINPIIESKKIFKEVVDKRKNLKIEKIGNIVFLNRVKLGISQQKLANMLGYTQNTSIMQIEKGITNIPKNKIYKLCKILSIKEKNELIKISNTIRNKWTSKSK